MFTLMAVLAMSSGDILRTELEGEFLEAFATMFANLSITITRSTDSCPSTIEVQACSRLPDMVELFPKIRSNKQMFGMNYEYSSSNRNTLLGASDVAPTCFVFTRELTRFSTLWCLPITCLIGRLSLVLLASASIILLCFSRILTFTALVFRSLSLLPIYRLTVLLWSHGLSRIRTIISFFLNMSVCTILRITS